MNPFKRNASPEAIWLHGRARELGVRYHPNYQMGGQLAEETAPATIEKLSAIASEAVSRWDQGDTSVTISVINPAKDKPGEYRTIIELPSSNSVPPSAAI